MEDPDRSSGTFHECGMCDSRFSNYRDLETHSISHLSEKISTKTAMETEVFQTVFKNEKIDQEYSSHTETDKSGINSSFEDRSLQTIPLVIKKEKFQEDFTSGVNVDNIRITVQDKNVQFPSAKRNNFTIETGGFTIENINKSTFEKLNKIDLKTPTNSNMNKTKTVLRKITVQNSRSFFKTHFASKEISAKTDTKKLYTLILKVAPEDIDKNTKIDADATKEKGYTFGHGVETQSPSSSISDIQENWKSCGKMDTVAPCKKTKTSITDIYNSASQNITVENSRSFFKNYFPSKEISAKAEINQLYTFTSTVKPADNNTKIGSDTTKQKGYTRSHGVKTQSHSSGISDIRENLKSCEKIDAVVLCKKTKTSITDMENYDSVSQKIIPVKEISAKNKTFIPKVTPEDIDKNTKIDADATKQRGYIFDHGVQTQSQSSEKSDILDAVVPCKKTKTSITDMENYDSVLRKITVQNSRSFFKTHFPSKEISAITETNKLYTFKSMVKPAENKTKSTIKQKGYTRSHSVETQSQSSGILDIHGNLTSCGKIDDDVPCKKYKSSETDMENEDTDMEFSKTLMKESNSKDMESKDLTEALEYPYRCGFCRQIFPTQNCLMKHLKTHEQEQHRCPFCKRSFLKGSDLQSHVTTHSSATPYECDYCPDKFSQLRELQIHRKQHKKIKYKCDLCCKSFTTIHMLDVHKSVHRREKPYECNICDKSFTIGGHLKIHLRLHTGNKPFKCSVCKKSFNSNNEVDIHMRNHTGERPFSCDVCQRSFKSNGHLNDHKRKHTEDKPYSCDICQKSFYHLDGIKKHMRSHTGEKPYKCETCEKGFARRDSLHKHERIHTGDKPYKCNICGSNFRVQSAIKVHLKTHTGEKNHKCKVCNKMFNQSGHLTSHMKTHAGIKNLECELCGQMFSFSQSLNRHLKLHKKKAQKLKDEELYDKTDNKVSHDTKTSKNKENDVNSMGNDSESKDKGSKEEYDVDSESETRKDGSKKQSDIDNIESKEDQLKEQSDIDTDSESKEDHLKEQSDIDTDSESKEDQLKEQNDIDTDIDTDSDTDSESKEDQLKEQSDIDTHSESKEDD